MKKKISIYWFRRDLRLHDNVGFSEALKGDVPVVPIFIFDSSILKKLDKKDARVSFIYQEVQKMRTRLLKDYDSSLGIYHGSPENVFRQLISDFDIVSVYTNRDYEPYALERDTSIGEILEKENISFKTFKDQVIFEKNDVVKDDGKPYVVYTPFKNKWKQNFNRGYLKEAATTPLFGNLIKDERLPTISLAELGFEVSDISVPNYKASPSLINDYEATRNFPAIKNGTSRLGPHLRFGTVSVREIMKKAIAEENEVFWSELIWREFFMQILWHFRIHEIAVLDRSTTVFFGETTRQNLKNGKPDKPDMLWLMPECANLILLGICITE